MHSLCDGGYHKWKTSICGAKHAVEADLKAFSCLYESVRKDVECLFGFLKNRFRILGVSSLAHYVENINNMVKVCSVLHNMLLEHDGLDVAGEEDMKQVDEAKALNYGVHLGLLSTFVVGSMSEFNDIDEQEVHARWDVKRRYLINHYVHALSLGQVFSLRTRDGRAENADA